MNKINLNVYEQIDGLNNERQAIFANHENWPDTHEAEVDRLGDEILNLVQNHHQELLVDFVLEVLSCLGQAPNVLYDDNGNWAIVGDGFQSVSAEDHPVDVELQFWVEAKHWFPTIREALTHYLTFEEDETEN